MKQQMIDYEPAFVNEMLTKEQEVEIVLGGDNDDVSNKPSTTSTSALKDCNDSKTSVWMQKFFECGTSFTTQTESLSAADGEQQQPLSQAQPQMDELDMSRDEEFRASAHRNVLSSHLSTNKRSMDLSLSLTQVQGAVGGTKSAPREIVLNFDHGDDNDDDDDEEDTEDSPVEIHVNFVDDDDDDDDDDCEIDRNVPSMLDKSQASSVQRSVVTEEGFEQWNKTASRFARATARKIVEGEKATSSVLDADSVPYPVRTELSAPPKERSVGPEVICSSELMYGYESHQHHEHQSPAVERRMMRRRRSLDSNVRGEAMEAERKPLQRTATRSKNLDGHASLGALHFDFRGSTDHVESSAARPTTPPTDTAVSAKGESQLRDTLKPKRNVSFRRESPTRAKSSSSSRQGSGRRHSISSRVSSSISSSPSEFLELDESETAAEASWGGFSVKDEEDLLDQLDSAIQMGRHTGLDDNDDDDQILAESRGAHVIAIPVQLRSSPSQHQQQNLRASPSPISPLRRKKTIASRRQSNESNSTSGSRFSRLPFFIKTTGNNFDALDESQISVDTAVRDDAEHRANCPVGSGGAELVEERKSTTPTIKSMIRAVPKRALSSTVQAVSRTPSFAAMSALRVRATLGRNKSLDEGQFRTKYVLDSTEPVTYFKKQDNMSKHVQLNIRELVPEMAS